LRPIRVRGWAWTAIRTPDDLDDLLLVLMAQLRDLLVQSSDPARIVQLRLVVGVAVPQLPQHLQVLLHDVPKGVCKALQPLTPVLQSVHLG
jgi:hypothetical protein